MANPTPRRDDNPFENDDDATWRSVCNQPLVAGDSEELPDGGHIAGDSDHHAA